MVRGWQRRKKQLDESEVMGPNPKKRRRFVPGTLEKKKEKVNKETLVVDSGPPEFGRTSKGQQLIRERLRLLLKSDSKAFPNQSLFNSEGFCRMKTPGASDITMQEILVHAPATLEIVCFVRISAHCMDS